MPVAAIVTYRPCPLRMLLAASLLLVSGIASAQVARSRAQALPVWNQDSGNGKPNIEVAAELWQQWVTS